MVSKIFKAKYFPRRDFLEANIGHNPSYSWRSIWSSRALVKEGYRWCVGDGSKINLWTQPWLRVSEKVAPLNAQLCRDCLPNKLGLLSRGVSCSEMCSSCPNEAENNWHIFSNCPVSVSCWKEVGLWDIMQVELVRAEGFTDLFFKLGEKFSKDTCALFGMIL